jgi:phage terminase small subunit
MNLLNQDEQEPKKQNNTTKSKLDLLKEQLIEPTVVNTEIETEFTPVSVQQYLFIDEYLKDFNGTQACIRAGYSEKGAAQTASRLLTYNNIQDEIARRRSLIAKATDVSIINATQDLYRLIEELYTDEKVDRNAQLKALDMIYKLNGLYKDHTTVNIQNNLNEIKIQIVRPTDGD